MYSLLRSLVLIGLLTATGWADWPEPLRDSGFDGSHTVDQFGAVGDGWLAMRFGYKVIRVLDTESGEELLSLEVPRDDLPDPSGNGDNLFIENFDRNPVADGDRLAALCRARVKRDGLWIGWKLVVMTWEVPDGRLVGLETMPDGNISETFTSLRHGRLVVFVPGPEAAFYQWDAENMDPLPAIALPDGVKEPDPGPSWHGYGRAWHGDDVLAYFPFVETSVFVSVDLKAGTVKQFDFPEGRRTMHSSVEPSGFGRTVLVPIQEGMSGQTFFVGFFDVDSGSFEGEVRLVEAPASNRMLIGASDDGRWHAFVGSQETHVFSGDGMKLTEVEGRGIGLRPMAGSNRYGLPYALRSGRLWLLRSGPSADGELAFSIPYSIDSDASLTFETTATPEADGLMSLHLQLDRPASREMTVVIDTGSGTAIEGEDFLPFPRQVRFAEGEVSRTVEAVLQRDQEIEPDEWFEVTLTESSGILNIVDPVRPCVIKGSEISNIGYTESWLWRDSVGPRDTALSGGFLIQTNRYVGFDYSVRQPKVFRKPLRGGSWMPSAVWVEDTMDSFDVATIKDSSRGTLLVVETSYPEVATVYDGATDTAIHRRDDGVYYTNHAVDADAFLYEELYQLEGAWEATWDGGPGSRRITTKRTGADFRYTSRFIVELGHSNEVRLYSRTTGNLVGQILKGKPWIGEPKLDTDGEFLVLHGERVVVCDLSGTSESGPVGVPSHVFLESPGSEASEFQKVIVTNGKVVAARIVEGGKILLDVFDARSGEWQGGSSCSLPDHLYQITYLRSLSGEDGSVIASFENGERFELAHFELDKLLPGVEVADDHREGEGGIAVRLNEAAPFDLTVEASLVAPDAEMSSRWQGGGAAVVIPAGRTSAYLPLMLVDDGTPKTDGEVQIEVTIQGGGVTSVRRSVVEFRDDDYLPLEGLTRIPFPKVEGIHALGDGWVANHLDAGLPSLDSLRWSSDIEFQTHYPVVPLDNPVAFHVVGAAEDWLAIRTAPIYGPTLASGLAPQLIVFKPQFPEAPVHYWKGVYAIDNFGSDVTISGDRIWVGIPGIGADQSTRPRAGSVRRYDLGNSLLRKTIRPPADVKWNFGKRMVNNGKYLWIASPGTSDGRGAITQYGIQDERFRHTIWAPEGNPNAHLFGEYMFQNDELLIVHLPDKVYPPTYSSLFGYSAESGDLLWTLSGELSPDERNFGYAAELIGDDLMVLASDVGWTFYGLKDPTNPRLLVQLRRPENSNRYNYSFRGNLPYLHVSSQIVGGGTEHYLLDLRQTSQLWPYVGSASDSRNWSSVFETGSESLVLQRGARSWAVELPGALVPPVSGELIMECSEDLLVWHEVLTLSESGEWQLHQSAAKSHALRNDGASLEILGERPACFLRFNHRQGP
ncbi:Calx-beta domain-containing protein [Haloferula sp.]|uniref:Calx-beta domain-containing protein n=1 Tax=Haloferula sp. TaxID=2497595 RepID=UPI003C73F0B6